MRCYGKASTRFLILKKRYRIILPVRRILQELTAKSSFSLCLKNQIRLVRPICNCGAKEKNGGLKIKLGIPFFFSPISNKRWPLSFFKTPTTFWTPWMQSSMVPTRQTTWGRGGGGGSAARQCSQKNEMSQSNRLPTLFLLLNRPVDVYLNFQKKSVFKS